MKPIICKSNLGSYFKCATIMIKFCKIFNKRTQYYSYSNLRSFSICIVGAGPAGFYCAQKLLTLIPSSFIDIYDKLPVPFGLVRYGVAPDHPEVKNVINKFTLIGASARVRFIGNVNIGTDIKIKDLRNAYNAVILSYGADQDIKLQIPGENLKNIVSARRFVGWYNGLPDDKDLPINFESKNATIIGHGNVAIDVARILLKPIDELKKTDITEYALSILSQSKVKTVDLIGRRGPLQVAFTIKEFRELLKLPQTRIEVDSTYFNSQLKSILAELPRARRRLTELLLNTSQQSANQRSNEAGKTLRVKFMRSPARFLGTNCLKEIELYVNRYKSSGVVNAQEVQDQHVEYTDEKEYISTGLAFRSIGYKSTQIESEIPFSFPHCIGHSKVLPGVYSAGWVSTGPVGVLLSTMTNAMETSNLIARDVQSKGVKNILKKPGYELIHSILVEKGIVTVDWEGWKRIDRIEILVGKERNKPREKMVNVEEMLKIGGNRN